MAARKTTHGKARAHDCTFVPGRRGGGPQGLGNEGPIAPSAFEGTKRPTWEPNHRRGRTAVASWSEKRQAATKRSTFAPSATNRETRRDSLAPSLCLLLVLLVDLLSLPAAAPQPSRRIARPVLSSSFLDSSTSPQQHPHGTQAAPSAAQPGIPSSTRSLRKLPAKRKAFSKENQLQYFNGSLLVNPITVHIVYYGSWARGAKDSGQKVIRSFLSSISSDSASKQGSVAAWWALNSLLYQKDGTLVSSTVRLGREVYDAYSSGKALNDGDAIWTILFRKFKLKALPLSSQAVYMVLTSPDVWTSDMCTSACGWHDTNIYTAPGSNIKTTIYYGWVGNSATQCPDVCASPGNAPNGNVGLDGLIDILGHELAEAATNPDTLTGWLTDQGEWGEENADICRKQYGRTRRVASRGRSFAYNMVGVAGMRFLVQTLYNPLTASCALQP